ncbi:hypothetical protein ACJJTC_010538 [Scirpophaga incertulas]
MITVIPMIKTRNNPDWSILMEHIGEKLQTQEIPGLFTVDSEKNGYIEFYPRSAWEYNMMWDQIIQDGFTIVGPPRWQPTKKPQPPLMPPHTDKMPIQTTTAIPTIKTRSNPDWSILTGHISEKLGSQDIPAAFTVDSDGDEYIEFYPRTAWEYDMMCDQIIRDDFTIDGPRWQPTNMTPQPPPKPPTTLTASHEASPARTPTPQLSVNASRDGSLMGTPTPTPPKKVFYLKNAKKQLTLFYFLTNYLIQSMGATTKEIKNMGILYLDQCNTIQHIIKHGLKLKKI